MNSKHIVIMILMALTLGHTATAQIARFSSFSYQGEDVRYQKPISTEGQYFNPILSGFYPDPSVCRVDDCFYLVNSSFAFYPGVPIWQSKDLVNWHSMGHVLTRESQLQLRGHDVSAGIFAPAISYNPKNKTFYMVTMNMGERKVFYVKTTDPHKGWSNPIYLKRGGMDPSFFFDKNGKGYMVYTTRPRDQRYSGEMSIQLLELDVKGDSVKGEPIELVRGGWQPEKQPQWIEGPHLYRVGKYYYLMCAQGGTQDDHSEVIFRSKSPFGPFEGYAGNPILTQSGLDPQRSDVVNSTGHADLIDDGHGNWWAVFLACRPYEDDFYHTGRETFLLPVRWEEGWPIILPHDTAVPTVVDKVGVRRDSTLNLTGNFAYTDTFKDTQLNQRWLSLRNPIPGCYSLHSDGLWLKVLPGSLYRRDALSAIFCRQQHNTFQAETTLDFTPHSEQEMAGLTLYQNEYYNYVWAKTLVEGKPALVLKRSEKNQEKDDASAVAQSLATLFLNPAEANQSIRLKVEGNGRYYSFAYAIGDGTWQWVLRGSDASNLSTYKAGGFIGTMIGLFATAN